MGGPRFQVERSLDSILHQSIEKRSGVDGGERLVDARSGLLVGKFDDVSGTRIKLSAFAGGLVFASPGHRVSPYLCGAPGVVTHDDDDGGVPLVLLFKQAADMS